MPLLNKPKDNPWRYAMLGTQLAVSVGLGVIAGYYVDKSQGSRPWGLIIGAALGGIVGFYLFFKEVMGPKP
jgi:F0F1-type ATP synthase assembly protein I